MVRMIEFNREAQIVVFETDEGNIKVTFKEWKQIVVDFYHMFGIEDISFSRKR